ncbi:unnamed protein product [Nesidiocoris tenuis]|uniref:Uncharacterized protein n=1 Tax=Nesidiocoris tenuis TaxID=355587 RepID=A0A6H5GPX1_9HEMI|nr:unnamed protein product [Nesidiocoris tenuis]
METEYGDGVLGRSIGTEYGTEYWDGVLGRSIETEYGDGAWRRSTESEQERRMLEGCRPSQIEKCKSSNWQSSTCPKTSKIKSSTFRKWLYKRKKMVKTDEKTCSVYWYLCFILTKKVSCCGNILWFEKCNTSEYAAGGHRPTRSDAAKQNSNMVFHTLLNVPYAFPAPRNTNFPLGRARESTTRYEHGDSRRFHGNDVSVPLVRVPTNAGIRSSDPQGIATIRRFHPLVFGYDRMSTTRTRYVSLRRCGCPSKSIVSTQSPQVKSDNFAKIDCSRCGLNAAGRHFQQVFFLENCRYYPGFFLTLITEGH